MVNSPFCRPERKLLCGGRKASRPCARVGAAHDSVSSMEGFFSRTRREGPESVRRLRRFYSKLGAGACSCVMRPGALRAGLFTA